MRRWGAWPARYRLTWTSAHRMFGDPAHQAVPFLEELDRAVAATATELDPIRVTRVALAGVYTDRIGPCRPALWRVIQ